MLALFYIIYCVVLAQKMFYLIKMKKIEIIIALIFFDCYNISRVKGYYDSLAKLVRQLTATQ